MLETVTVCDIFFYNPPMLNIRFGAGAIEAGAGFASRYGFGSTKINCAAPARKTLHCKYKMDCNVMS
jgi:hypothetical protein